MITTLLASLLLAQSGATLSGTIFDAATGLPMPGVQVTLTSPALAGPLVAHTDAAGGYAFAQLPPGTYDLRGEPPDGYDGPALRPGIRLHAGQTTRVNALHFPAQHESKLDAWGGAPAVDFASPATGLVLDRDFIDRVPFIVPNASGARDAEALAAPVPQVLRDRYGFGFSGSQSPENAYLVDGVSVRDPAFGLKAATVPVEFLEEAHVLTGGLPAEYGKTTGGVLSLVTKSGTNEFHGSVWGAWSPGLLSGTPKVPRDDVSIFVKTTAPENTFDVGGEVSGPIVKDRLWFYAGFSPSFRLERSTRITNRYLLNSDRSDFLYDSDGFIQMQEIPGTRKSMLLDHHALSYFAKLTFQATPHHRLSLSVLGSPGADVTPGSFEPRRAGGLTHSSSSTTVTLGYGGAFFDRHLLADATLAYFRTEQTTIAADGSKLGATPGDGTQLGTATVAFGRTHPLTDFETVDGVDADGKPWCEPAGSIATRGVVVRGVVRNVMQCPASGNGQVYVIGGAGYVSDVAADRLTGRASLTWLAQAAGHHVARAGVELEREAYDVRRGLSGGTALAESPHGVSFYDRQTYGFFTGPDVAQKQLVTHATPTSLGLAAWLQDSWSVMDLVTVNAGLRYENQQLFAGDGTLGLTLNNMLSPRVGVAWDFTRQGRSRVFASYARYFEAMPLDIADRSLTGESHVSFYRYRVATPRRPGCDPLADIAQATGACQDPANYVPINSEYQVSRAGTAIGQGRSAVDATTQPQNLHELLAGAEYELIPRLRLSVSWTHRMVDRVVEDMSIDEASTYFVGNPGYGLGELLPKAVRDYDAVTASVSKSFSDGWLAQASYTWSSLRGNYNGLFRPESGQLDPNISSDFDLVSLMKNRSGPLGADNTHVIRAYVAKQFVFSRASLDVGLAYEGFSGSPVNVFAGAGSGYGLRDSFLLPRGSGGRLPWQHTINARVAVSYRFAGGLTASVSAEVFNLFNFQAVTSVDETYTFERWLPVTVAPGQNPLDLVCFGQDPSGCRLSDHVVDLSGRAPLPTEINPSFKRPTSFQAPISTRLAVKLSF